MKYQCHDDDDSDDDNDDDSDDDNDDGQVRWLFMDVNKHSLPAVKFIEIDVKLYSSVITTS